MNGGNGKSSNQSTLPFLSQIAEEDLTSASTSVTSFHLSNNNNSRRNQPLSTLPPPRTLSDQDLFTRVDNDLGQDSANKPLSYSHFNFEQSSKQQLIKGNSLVSMSSDSVDMPLNNGDTTRRKVHTNSPPNDSTAESSPLFISNSMNNKVTLRKQTQNIAARAAQRRANLHHKELMEDMGSGFSYEPILTNESTASAFGLEITGVKPKKTVTINDRVNDFRRTNSDSPELLKDPFYSTTNNRTTKNQQKKRSICKYFLSNKTNRLIFNCFFQLTVRQ
jgi:hypothetical protein